MIAMSKITIQQVFGIDGTTLMVFVALEHCWQLGLISAGGAVFGEGKIYYTAKAALKARLECLGIKCVLAMGIHS